MKKRRFKDGRIYEFVNLRFPRRGFFHPPNHLLTVRYCPAGSKSTGSTWRERRAKLQQEAWRITRNANRLMAQTRFDVGAIVFEIAGTSVRLRNVGLFMGDWAKLSRTGVPEKLMSQSVMRRHWLSQPHRSNDGPGARGDQP